MSIIIGDRCSAELRDKYQLGGPRNSSQLEPNTYSIDQSNLKTQNSMPCSLNSRRNTQNLYRIDHSLLDEQIINCQLSLAAKKDFNEEIRALLDVRKFVYDSFILIDIHEIRISAILETIIDRLVERRQLGDQVAEEAKSLLVVERSSLNMLLANTMQGIYKSRSDGRLAYDHSWVVACCSLSSLHKRQVAIARFAHPVNFGRQSQEVRFLIIVLAPSKEKLTKSAWEVGRTFATMFTDIDFRRRLLRAKCQEEIKAELLVRAERLAHDHEDQSQLVSQHSDASSLAFDSFVSNNGKKPLTTSGASFPFGSQAAKAKAKKSHHTNKGKGGTTMALCCTRIGSGLVENLKRRAHFYLSDFTDGLLGERSLYKTISTTIFLYFSVLLPCIAFGVVDTNNTEGAIDPKKTMIGQALGGLFFALFSGQPLIVIMTTAPLCIYVKVIYQISQDLEVDFGSFYAMVGLWMCLFLVLMSISNSSNLMKYCTRSTEDIFALFTAFAFGSDGIKEAIRSFNKYYWDPECSGGLATLPTMSMQQLVGQQAHHPLAHLGHPNGPGSNSSGPTHELGPLVVGAPENGDTASLALFSAASGSPTTTTTTATATQIASSTTGHQQNGDNLLAQHRCQRETCVLFLFLMCGTLWLANSFSSFNRTPYLSARKREIIKDYALAIAVLIFSFIGSYLFAEVRLDVFEFGSFNGLSLILQWSPQLMKAHVLGTTAALGFALAVLFYIDQNICGAMVNNAPYKLKKGDYFHLDLFILAILNAILSLTGLPWMHAKLPHSHLHSKALADYEERVDEGHIHQIIVNIRETRLTGIFTSLLVAVSLLAVPYPLSYIPLPVLSGVFLYTALSEFKSNSMVERVCLLFTEQAAYPPNHYIRRCPQRKIHFFTMAQLVQLAIVSFVGFYPNPYVNMAFPLVVATFVPVRELLLPRLIDAKFLNSLDNASLE